MLDAIKLYSNPRSLLVFQKLCHTYAIKKHKGKRVPFLAGGVYHGCKGTGITHSHDTLYMKHGVRGNDLIKVDDFRAFSLVTNKVFLSPQALAAHLYKFMDCGTVQEHAPLHELRQKFTL